MAHDPETPRPEAQGSAPLGAAQKSALRTSLLDGVLYAIMVGCSESYLGALAVELGHRDTSLALLSTVPLLVGASVQLGSGSVARRLGSRKRLVVAGAAVQAATHLGFIWIAHTAHPGLLALLACKCAFFASGMLIAPPWGSWMASLIEGRPRERYFAMRSGLVQVALLLSFWFAGGHLRHFQLQDDAMRGFTQLMSVALVARAASAATLSLQADPERGLPAAKASMPERFRASLEHARWRVAIYIALLGFGAFVAVPFFTPYMLRVLGFDYRQFAVLTATTISTKALLFPLAHLISRRIGLRATLTWGGAGVAAIPYLWSLDPSYELLLAVHVLSGGAWALVEYASFQLLLASADDRYRLDFLALAGTVNGLLQVTGSLVGGLLLDLGKLEYQTVFVLSCVGRTLPLALLITLPRAALPTTLPKLVFRLLGVTPVIGSRFRPIVKGVRVLRRKRKRGSTGVGSDSERGD